MRKNREKHEKFLKYTRKKKGIIHYLGTNGGKDEFSNPHLMGLLTVSASSLERGIMLDLVAQEPNELVRGKKKKKMMKNDV